MLKIPQYFEEFECGFKAKTASRTISEADILSFAGISGNFHPLHLSREFAKKTPFEKNLSHGLLILSILEGLIERTRLIDKIVAFYGIDKLRFMAPVYAGNTITGSLSVISKKELPENNAGLITFELSAVKENSVTVLTGTATVLLAKKP